MDERRSFPFWGKRPIFRDYVNLRGCISWFWILFAAPNIAPSQMFVFFTNNQRVGRHKVHPLVHPSGHSGECFFLRLHSLVFENSFMSFWCYFCFMKCYQRDRMLYMKPFLTSNGLEQICYIQAAFADVRCVAVVSPIHLVLMWGQFPQQTNVFLRDFQALQILWRKWGLFRAFPVMSQIFG